MSFKIAISKLASDFFEIVLQVVPVAILTSSIVFLEAEAASGFPESVTDFAQIAAKETATLQSLKHGLDLQISQLRKANDAKMSSKATQLQALQQELNMLHVAVDEAQSSFDDTEKKSKALSTGGGLESATKDLRRTLETFEARSRKTAMSTDSMVAFSEEVTEAVKVLKRASDVREEAGAYKLKDGTIKQGGLKWLGETAVFGKSENGLIALGPDGVGGWLALNSGSDSGAGSLAAVFSDLRVKVDVSTVATTADRLAGLVPIFWLGLLGMAVSWLFVSIAKH